MAKKSVAFNSALKMVNYLYKYQLMNEPITSTEAFESGEFTIKECQLIDKIGQFYDKLEAIISKYLQKSWKWNRIPPLEQTLLIYGAFALQFTDKALIINEIVKITQLFIPGTNFKYINGILDKIGKEYEQTKNR